MHDYIIDTLSTLTNTSCSAPPSPLSIGIGCNGLSGLDLVPIIEESVVGRNAGFLGPLGPRRIFYADWFASGKSLSFIEDYLAYHVLPFYANTHTETGINGQRTGAQREMSREVIKTAISSSKDEISLIFCGSGSTAGLNKLSHMFLKNKSLLDRVKYLCLGRPVVFVSIQEHHSNILPWRMAGAQVVFIQNNEKFQICLLDLERKLKQYRHRALKIAALTAGSNVTGVLNDTVLLSILAHANDAYCVFDYAGVGSYVEIDMNTKPVPLDKVLAERASNIPDRNQSLATRMLALKEIGLSSHQVFHFLQSKDSTISAYYDAIVLSPHKLVGGPGTPGCLALQNSTLRVLSGSRYVPSQVGGGIVEFVTVHDQVLISHLEHREETGTPAIIESIRAGLAFSVKQMVGCDVIAELEQQHIDLIRAKLTPHPNIVVLGGLEHENHLKVPVLAFLIKLEGKFFHYNFVAALLNDFFGIQARAGCACAGPYGAELLHIENERVMQYQKICTPSLVRACPFGKSSVQDIQLNSFKPGFTRLSFNYFTKREDVEFVLDAMIWISINAEKVMDAYNYSVETGNWYFAAPHLQLKEGAKKQPPDAHNICIGRFVPWSSPAATPSKAECFQQADEFVILMQAEKCVIERCAVKERIRTDKKLARLQWFVDHSAGISTARKQGSVYPDD